ncbi:MAG: triose-phosphate isomerase [Candidatus Binatus sp.]|uniref:triose-phosphate isomerase n=1 Tax=Candidatus Binatus sp. TaxID=2811406 RepID=UPI002723CBC7|nr:triose-phosphate isomerase [Candidatus Binatus sp.]MDO8431015.1 triose-phosphate isomerase [Candidatus Binatus sp.]
MRRRFFLANWKMNVTVREARVLAAALRDRIDAVILQACEVVIAPPMLAMPTLAQELAGSRIAIAGANMYCEDKGPFTGEVSASMLKEVGASYVLIGHSERRDLFHEDDGLINRKLKAALRDGLTPVLCVGEHADERDAGRVLEVVLGQLQRGLDEIDGSRLAQVVVAYEPVWAVGTGRTAQPQAAELVHGSIRSGLGDLCGRNAARRVRIVYGGSVTPTNAAAYLSQPDIDGLMVGAASLDPDSFVQILKAGTVRT